MDTTFAGVPAHETDDGDHDETVRYSDRLVVAFDDTVGGWNVYVDGVPFGNGYSRLEAGIVADEILAGEA